MGAQTISVIIPAYNRADTIVRAISSCINQSLEVHEIIVVDDCSVDKTVDIVRAHFPSVRLLTRATNGGSSVARNDGIRAATGDWIAFLDADDEWKPGFVAEITRLILSSPDVGMVFAGYEHRSLAGDVTPCAFSAGTHHRYEDKRIGLAEYAEIWLRDGAPPMCTDVSVCKAAVLREVGMFREAPECRRGQDTDLWIRMLSVTKAAFTPEILATFHKRSGSNSSARIVRPCHTETIRSLQATLVPAEAAALRKVQNWKVYAEARVRAAGDHAIPNELTSAFYWRDAPLRYVFIIFLRFTPRPLYRVLVGLMRRVRPMTQPV